MDVKVSEQQYELVERMGVFYEQLGMPPTESRILALLVVCDSPELTFDQIRELLKISKSATSNALNLLLLSQQIVYRTKLGDRKRYFSSNIVNWEASISSEIQKMFKVTELLKETLAQRTPETPEFNRQLATFIEFMEFLHGQFPHIFELWKEHKQQKTQQLQNKHA